MHNQDVFLEQTLLEEGRFKAAKNEFDEALKLVPVDQAALNGRYLADLFLGFNAPDWDPAVGHAIQRHLAATATDARDRFAHVVQKYLGDLNSRIGNTPLRDSHYQDALKRKPDYPDALFTVGWIYYSESDPDGMEETFRKMAKINPHDYRGLHGLGYALYMKAIREQDPKRRADLIADATMQSDAAKNLSINLLHIVMDFGEVARSGDPWVSLHFHKLGRKILDNPRLNKLGDNAFGLTARLLVVGDRDVFIETQEQKLAWIEYQIALDHIAMHRKGIAEDGQAQHDAMFETAKGKDSDGIALSIYNDQLAILDRLLPMK